MDESRARSGTGLYRDAGCNDRCGCQGGGGVSASWSEQAAEYVTDWARCPRCDFRPVEGGRCSNCGAVLTGESVRPLIAASADLADAIMTRQRLIDALPVQAHAPAPVAAAAPAPTAAASAAAASPVAADAAARPQAPAPAAANPYASVPAARESTVSVQSVLSVTGAGLVAVAAIVFTFFNPDLTAPAARAGIVAVVAALFIAGAWMLARRGLRFSAESIGALGAVFAFLAVGASVQNVPQGSAAAFLAASATLVVSAVLFVVGVLARVRVWLLGAIVGLSISPLLFLLAAGGAWAWVLGSIGATLAVLVVQEVLRGIGGRLGMPLRAERVTANSLQGLATLLVPFQVLAVLASGGGIDVGMIFAVSGVGLAIAASSALATRNGAGAPWSLVAGAAAVGAVGILPIAAVFAPSTAADAGTWQIALVPAAAGVGVLVLGALPLRSPLRVSLVHAGALAVLAVAVLPALLAQTLSLVLLPRTLASGGSGPLPNDVAMPIVIGAAAAAAAGLGLFLLRRRDPVTRAGRYLAFVPATFALLGFISWNGFVPGVQITIGLIATAAICAAVLRWGANPTGGIRGIAIVIAHVVLVFTVALSWSDQAVAVIAGLPALAVLALVARTRSSRTWPWYAGIGYAYALIVVAGAFDLAHVQALVIVCLVAAIAAGVGLLVTLTRWLPARYWIAVLIVTAVPFLAGVAAVITERSGWSALSTAASFALALALVRTHRAGMKPVLRTIAAGLLVPALSVLATCLGAWLLDSSGSPVVLPAVAVIIAVGLAVTPTIGRWASAAGAGVAETEAVRVAVEASAALTGVIAVVLSLVRVAAGLPTTFLVFAILGVGYCVFALLVGRRYAWTVAGVSFTGALWSVWGILGVELPEAYIAPPALAAVIVGCLLVSRSGRGVGLAIGGLAFVILPSLLLLARGPYAGWGSGQAGADAGWRSPALLAAAVLLIVADRVLTRMQPVRPWFVLAAVVGAAGGAVQAARWAFGADAAPTEPAMWAVLGLSALAALVAAVAAASPRARAAGRWRYAPALVYLVAAPIAGIGADPVAIVVLILLTAALLVFMIVIAARSVARATTAPPVWFVFALAWCTAVAAWSERTLRVEAFSIPLGAALLVVGIIAMRADAAGSGTESGIRSLTSWPIGFTRSWHLLAPGLIVLFLPSVLATGTDPQTWRAIGVMSLALAAIIIGSLRRLAAPFIIGLAVVPVEILVVFIVQLGRTINPLLWWITLASAGAVLLVIAVTTEGKGAEGGRFTARLRDLG